MLHPNSTLLQCGVFFTPTEAQILSAFTILNVTQACINSTNAKLHLRNSHDFNTYSGGNIFATAPRKAKKTVNKILSTSLTFKLQNL